MKHEGNGSREAGAHAALWWGLAAIAAPVMYLLTLPPLVILVMRPGHHATPSYIPPGHRSPSEPPKWLLIYVAPAQWLTTKTPLKEPYQEYCNWCFERMLR